MVVSVAGEPLLAFLLASVRIASWLVIVPPFSTRAVPTMVKVVLALALALASAPMLSGADLPLTAAGLVMTTATQVAIGLSLGFVTMLLLSAIAAAGSLVDLFGGFALAQGFDPLGQNMNTVFGTFHQWLATMLLFATGGHLLVLGGLLRTFELLPLDGAFDLTGVPAVVSRAFSVFFVVAVQVALPLVAVMFVTDLGLALMTKVAPQLNALSVMFPAKIGMTLILVGLSFPALPGVVRRVTELSMDAMARIAGAG
ncbi:MAG: flagellar biosynthetic protein FliR [Nocardioides sp.]|nr:flagellar biosynthetic protein FliR [Nocardioides sp.]